jgi:hypothetical protein
VKLFPGQVLKLDLPGVQGLAGPVAARVVNVSSDRTLEPPTATAPGRVFIAAVARLEPAELARVGLPRYAAATLPVETRVVTARESWLRWLLGAIGVPRE